MKKLLIFLPILVLFVSFEACRSSKKSQKNTSTYVLKEELPNSNPTTETTKTPDSVDEFSNQLKAAANENMQISRANGEVSVSFEPTIVFDSNSDVLDESAKNKLSQTAKILSKYNYLEIFIEGHADSSGVQIKNKKLSQDRAKNVALFLKTQGVKTDRLAISGYGATKPLVSNETPEGRRRNRRVYIKVRLKESQF